MARLGTQNDLGQNGFPHVRNPCLVLFLQGPPTLSAYKMRRSMEPFFRSEDRRGIMQAGDDAFPWYLRHVQEGSVNFQQTFQAW